MRPQPHAAISSRSSLAALMSRRSRTSLISARPEALPGLDKVASPNVDLSYAQRPNVARDALGEGFPNTD